MQGIPAPQGPRIAYLLSRYPAISHTFFLQEVIGLRALGLHIETASINPPDRPLHALPPLEAQEAANTFYVKTSSKPRALLTVFLHPLVLLRGLRAVAKLPRLTWKLRRLWFFYLVEAMLVGHWMRQRNLQHLHVHFGGPVASVGMLASIAWKLPYSLTIHGPEELLDVEKYHLREKVQQASFIICISNFCRSQVLPLVRPEQSDRISVIRLGVTQKLLQMLAVTDKKHPGTGSIQILCTGRLVPEKAQHILLQAFSMARSSGIHVRLDFIGDGPERSSLEAFTQHHGLADAVRFLGALSHEETIQHLQKADIFALPSFAEGIPVALMEAMALGIPCISTTIAGIPELIRHGQDGLLVPPSNVRALADAIALLALDKDLRHCMGTSAQQQVTDEYNLTKNHLQLAELLQKNIVCAKDTRR